MQLSCAPPLQDTEWGLLCLQPYPQPVRIGSCTVHSSLTLFPQSFILCQPPLHIFLSPVSYTSHFPFMPCHVLHSSSSFSHIPVHTWVYISPFQLHFQKFLITSWLLKTLLLTALARMVIIPYPHLPAWLLSFSDSLPASWYKQPCQS